MGTFDIQSQSSWSKSEKNLFKFFGLYFFIQILPIDLSFLKHIAGTNWLALEYRDIFYLSRYAPDFLGEQSFLNWIIVAILALVGTILWDKVLPKDINYDNWYYWIRVFVRYRLALGLIGYAFLKVYTIQSPEPSLSNLNTNYGDFTAWKLFSLGLGVVPSYQSFLGLVELAGALLLLHRKTTTIGTLIILPFAGNVAISNIAYEGGEYVYAFYLISLGLYLFAFDAIRLFKLVSLEQPADQNHFQPEFREKKQLYRLTLKGLYIIVFVIFYGYKTKAGASGGGYHFPSQAGLSQLTGVYNVKTFKLNNQEIPYSKTDSVRWQDVIFEKWNTISIKSNREVNIENLPTEEIFSKDSQRIYELAGTQGRHFYSYQKDPSSNILQLTNRNAHYQNDVLTIHYQVLNDSTVVLSGIDAHQDSVYAVLEKLNKKYLINEAKKVGRRSVLKL